MIYEIREYVPTAGRLGDAIELFNEVLIPLVRRHGMPIVQAGFTTFGDHSFNEIVYTLRFDDLAELERKWAAFLADADWQAALAEREAERPLYQTIRRRVVNGDPFALQSEQLSEDQ